MKRVAFDIGNVLCHIDFESYLNFLVTYNIASSKTDAFEFMRSLQNQIDLGWFDFKQCFYRYDNKLDKHIIQKLYDEWLLLAQPSIPMIDFIDKLINRYGYEVALLSNIGLDHSCVLNEKCPIFKKCIKHFSCDIGARKPSKLFYQSFIFQYNWSNDVLFFDDREENLKAAKGYLSGILFDIEKYNNDNNAVEVIRNYLNPTMI